MADETYVIDPDGTLVEVPERADIKPPSMWNVVFWNDDYTPMDFVVELLEKYFGRTKADAVAIMMAVHTGGRAIAGTFTHDIAETKMVFVTGIAQQSEFPLKVSIEEAE